MFLVNWYFDNINKDIGMLWSYRSYKFLCFCSFYLSSDYYLVCVYVLIIFEMNLYCYYYYKGYFII